MLNNALYQITYYKTMEQYIMVSLIYHIGVYDSFIP
jgi:hypothetical protein